MEREYRNIYKSARVSKGLTQEKSAELLNISVDSIRAYESGKTAVSNDVCADMITIYSAEHLAIQHLRQNQLGREAFADFEVGSNLGQAIISLIKELRDVVQCENDLINIAADGFISEDERPQMERILKECSQLQSAIMALKYAKHEKS